MRMCSKIQSDRLLSSLIIDQIPKFQIGIFFQVPIGGDLEILLHQKVTGFFEKLDLCCRKHDHCPEEIKVGETLHGIKNTNLGSISHCDCDNGFYKYLKNAKRPETDIVGFRFFNIFAMPCIRKDYPVVKCLEKARLTKSQCQKYLKDTSPEKKMAAVSFKSLSSFWYIWSY